MLEILPEPARDQLLNALVDVADVGETLPLLALYVIVYVSFGAGTDFVDA